MIESDVENLARSIGQIARTQPEIRLVYLFGSQASGEVGPLSDIDLGVLLAPETPLARIRPQLESLLAAALAGRPFDLIILNQAPIELAYAIIVQGKVLYERDRGERVEYEADVMSRYGDYLPYLRIQRQAILEGVGDEHRVRRYREALGRAQRALGALGALARSAQD